MAGGALFWAFTANGIKALPWLAAQKVKALFEGKAVIDGREIVRPSGFSLAEKAAFDDVATALDVLVRQRNLHLYDFADHMLAYPHNRFRISKKMPLESWHRVMKPFIDAGAVAERWLVRIPAECDVRAGRESNLICTAQWDRYGNKLPNGGFYDLILDAAGKAEHIGKLFALARHDELRPEQKQLAVVLEDRHFSRTYVRVPAAEAVAASVAAE